MRRNVRRNAICALTAAGGALLTLGGCAGGDAKYVSPSADTLGYNNVEIDNGIIVRTDTHLRMLLEDLATLTYQERPTRLSRKPIPY